MPTTDRYVSASETFQHFLVVVCHRLLSHHRCACWFAVLHAQHREHVVHIRILALESDLVFELSRDRPHAQPQ